MNIYSKIHGTTADRFRMGLKNQRITFTGETETNEAVVLTNSENVLFVANSTVFFTVYIVGQGDSAAAAYEIKGCYINESSTLTGYVVNTFVDSDNFVEPIVVFNEANEIIVTCNGVEEKTIKWTAIADFVIV
jgi:hypothetical protein